MTTPTTLPGVSGTWKNNGYEYRLRDTYNTYAVYDLWFVSQARWIAATHTNMSIKVTFATNTWSDNGSHDPVQPVVNGIYIELYDSNSSLLYKFTKPTDPSWVE